MKIGLIGFGALGQAVYEDGKENEFIGIVSPGYLTHISEFTVVPDCIIDCSHPNNLLMICEYATAHKVPVIIATTGHSDEQVEQIVELSEIVPVLYTANFSLGITIMNKLVKEITPLLKANFDIEIIEKHHNKKIDAPSGTAKMLMSSINADDEFNFVYGRSGVSPHQKKDVGVHSLRAGTIAGEHQVIYAGTDEVLEIRHEAHSKRIFSKGIITGLNWLMDKPKGLYNMDDVLFGK